MTDDHPHEYWCSTCGQTVKTTSPDSAAARDGRCARCRNNYRESD